MRIQRWVVCNTDLCNPRHIDHKIDEDDGTRWGLELDMQVPDEDGPE